jgi:hypothetical protein
MSHLSPRTDAPPCLPLDIKDSLKEDFRLLLFALGFWLLDEGRLFDVGGFGRENEWLKVELLKENC